MANSLSDTLTSLLDTRRIRRTLSFAQGFRSRFGFRWWYLVAGVLLLAAVGWGANTYLERAIKRQKAVELATLLDADVTAMRVWLDSEKGLATVVAGDPVVRQLVSDLLTTAEPREGARERLLASPSLVALRTYLRPIARARGYIDFVVSSPSGMVLAAARDHAVGNAALVRHAHFLAPAIGGLSMVSRPFRAEVPLPDEKGELAWGRPTMFVAAPVADESGNVLAALGLRIRPEVDFTRILHVARPGESGETYAFDVNGLMVSQSRFDAELRSIGLLPGDPSVRAIFNVELKDPGGNMVQGFQPTVARSRQPLTRMAEAAIGGEAGVDVDGYRDYRGVSVIGAWTWLQEYGFGVATEVDVDEAFRVLHRIRNLFRGLFALLVLASIGMVLSTVVVSRVGERASAALARAQRLGQYTLEDKIGAGGMGEVFRARHAMLRRPTAIKLVGSGSEADMARFEREVQITSQLTHPNTVAIYDFGRTPEGLFYYAMEYLPGLPLERLVELAGPLPAGRVIHLLIQACGSLGEAHQAGLVHRDIKPPNLMVCERGGVHDVVKVLDFGIVYDRFDPRREVPEGFVGTPLYVSPEVIRRSDVLDARSDLYSLGAVAYFMLTGRPVFDGERAVEICNRHLEAAPVPPSELAPVPADLERVVLRCLAKEPTNRPADTAELISDLEQCAAASDWVAADAQGWWQEHATEVAALRATAEREGGVIDVELATRPG